MDDPLPATETIHLSLGENCLTQGILMRHGLKTAKTPYSDTRSNLDYALHLERDRYETFLDRAALQEGWAGRGRVVRKVNMTSDRLYDDAHRKGFEFTHHDVIHKEEHRESYRRKVARLNELRGRGNLCFVYHYRVNPDMDIRAIIDKAIDFSAFYSGQGRACRVLIFTQEIVARAAERDVVEVIKDNVSAYVLKTLQAWRGEDQDVFWARRDDDLLAHMFRRAGLKPG